MILNEREIQICLEYAIKPLLDNYSVYIKESHFSIDEQIHMKAVIIYQDHIFDINASFSIAYQKQHICFYDIVGKVEYLFLQLNLMSVLQQIIHDEHILFKENSCLYKCDLPIQDINLLNHHIEVILK